MSEVEFKRLAREMSGKQNTSSSILLLTVITLIMLVVAWSAITEIDSVVRGSGKTVSEVKNQLVQSSEPGVILRRNVNNGAIVNQGDVLFEIDPIEAKTQLDQVIDRQSTLLTKIIRLKAEVQSTTPNFSKEELQAANGAALTEQALYEARQNDLKTKIAIIEQKTIQKNNEITETDIEILTASNSLELLELEIEKIQPLVETGLAPETRLIALKREREAITGKISAARASKERLRSGLQELNEELKAEQQVYQTSALTELSAVQAELSEIENRIPVLTDRVERTLVKSPVDGIVNRINYSTTGAYVKTGDVLLEIVPTGENLLVEAKVSPKDIADILVGQSVKISLTAYDPTRYGRLDGIVSSVSADAITDNTSGEQHYLVDVTIENTLFEKDGREVLLLPGMVASIDVLASKRTILEYFWQPISRTKQRAFRE